MEAKCQGGENAQKTCIYIQWKATHLQNNEIMPFASAGKDLEIIVLNEVSLTEKDKHRMLSFICGI